MQGNWPSRRKACYMNATAATTNGALGPGNNGPGNSDGDGGFGLGFMTARAFDPRSAWMRRVSDVFVNVAG
jgi:hypothetical protein